MRFIAFEQDGIRGLGAERNGQLRGLLATDPDYPGHLHDLIRGGHVAISRAHRLLEAGETVDRDRIRYLPPIERPSKIVCVGLNYADHTRESPYEQPSYPTFFPRFASSLIAHGDALVRPSVSEQFDFEGELAVIIGVGGRHIDRAKALEHVAGYSIFNEGSVRDFQFLSPQWTVGKNFDGTGAFGPVFVTADELPPGASGLRLQTRLNGEIVQDGNTADMIFDVANLISTLSVAITLEPGDVIVTGTPAGIGWARKPPLFMRPGDVCSVEIEGIGTLINPVDDEALGRSA
ncbi:MAG TPA: fumarylacetoacetate hydrolase family protein [Rhodocyclaceae bacterium]|uniref:fumarylacetoacetate hydrolase family protein n=1 Tax=Thauera sp. TaxID=1905334 RepID=UPI002BD399CD|nr:fumarylacetoacetate hydrolase family protein [Thauera sp.]HRP23943.1 fumarylacetoacetate hydrolase family protein [Thauera sp.]HRQ48043.1 fumarylacetoacetate hydrolase family protein [Rhodocyclaceae bacterium]